jgi:hypothetical protein
MLGATLPKDTESDGQMTFAIPIGKGQRCWMALAIVDQKLLPIQVEILEKEGPFHPLGTLFAARSAIPKLGAFCALQGNFTSVRLRPNRGTFGNASLTFFVSD